jgi:hypothetical protein
MSVNDSPFLVVHPIFKLYENKKFWEQLIANFHFIYITDRTENEASKKFFFRCVCIFCRGNTHTETLPSNLYL